LKEKGKVRQRAMVGRGVNGINDGRDRLLVLS